jgi:nitroimidazol reductase NimA-like FMN-containing flavoprotein (pyridoxamine 5'-phosphate oxidase superfamily)
VTRALDRSRGSTPWAGKPLDVRRTFRDVPVVHTGSLLADGSPHVVPLWFVWLEEGVVVTCRVGSQVWANLRRNPRVVLQFDRGRAWTEHAGVVIRGTARFLAPTDPPGKRALSAWFEKYREELAGPGFAAYTEQVTEPALFRVEASRVAGWIHGRAPATPP